MNKPSHSTSLPADLCLLAPFTTHDLIRLGRDHDGGYLVPKSVVEKSDCLISLGINHDWSFDEDFLKIKPNLMIHGYDHTISKRIFRRNWIRCMRKFFLGKASLGFVKDQYRIYVKYQSFFQENRIHFKERIHNRLDFPNDVTPDVMFGRCLDSKNIFLKIDIEGGEYRIIDSIMKHAEFIVGIAIEFHETDPYRAIFIEAIKKLQEDFAIVHIHGNNDGPLASDLLPETLEITFVKKNLIPTNTKRFNLPIQGLDQPNNPNKPQYQLIFNC